MAIQTQPLLNSQDDVYIHNFKIHCDNNQVRLLFRVWHLTKLTQYLYSPPYSCIFACLVFCTNSVYFVYSYLAVHVCTFFVIILCCNFVWADQRPLQGNIFYNYCPATRAISRYCSGTPISVDLHFDL